MRSTKRGAAQPVAWLALLLALTVPAAVSGCSTAQPNAHDLRRPATASAGPADPDRVVAVRVLVSGGIAGVHEVYRVTRADAPKGVSAAEADRVLALAARLASRPERKASGLAAGCCDRLLYDVTVRHADGSRAQIRFGGAKPPPEPLLRLVKLVAPAG
jgi:hypothetical protein